MTEDHQATDPDIDTVPLIAWSEDLMKQPGFCFQLSTVLTCAGNCGCSQVHASGRSMIVLQHIIMWPLLFVAYINWLYKSVGHLVFQPEITTKQRGQVARARLLQLMQSRQFVCCALTGPGSMRLGPPTIIH
eukprot:scaffold21683_cov17-Tisochrysis_lutea.AAC.1